MKGSVGKDELFANMIQVMMNMHIFGERRGFRPKLKQKLKRVELSLNANVVDEKLKVGGDELYWAALHIFQHFASPLHITFDIRYGPNQVTLVARDDAPYRRMACRRVTILMLAARRWTALCRNVLLKVARLIWATRSAPGWYTHRLEDEPLAEGIKRLK